MPQKADDPNFKGLRQRVEQENKYKYFHVMLNMADDDLPAYEYRLLGHYIRVGTCWEGIRTTAKKTHMSVGMVSKTRDKLVEAGYIKVEYRDNNESCLVTVVDRMAENVARYTTQGVHTVNTPVHGVNTSVHGVNERITIEEEPIKNDAPSGDSPSPAKQKRITPHYEHYLALLTCYGFVDETMPKSKKAQYLKVAAELHRIGVPIDCIPPLYAYVANMAKEGQWAKWTVNSVEKYAPEFMLTYKPHAAAPVPPPIDDTELETIRANSMNRFSHMRQDVNHEQR